jgi:hypothetical protein
MKNALERFPARILIARQNDEFSFSAAPIHFSSSSDQEAWLIETLERLEAEPGAVAVYEIVSINGAAVRPARRSVVQRSSDS